jgi:hypothetical protein
VLDEEIVLKLVGGLKDGRDHAVCGAQQHEGNKDGCDSFVLICRFANLLICWLG